MTPGSDDASLLEAHLDGDPDAFAELVRRHRDRLWAVALRTIGAHEQAADAVQAALPSASRRVGTFPCGPQAWTWLHRTVATHCHDPPRPPQAGPEGTPLR